MSTPLERPSLPPIDEPIPFEGYVVSVFGKGDLDFARALDEGLREAGVESVLIRVELRHARGFVRDGDASFAHPDALLDALRDRRSTKEIVIGVGAPFAVAVRSDLTVWIADGTPRLALPPALRTLSKTAQLTLEGTRPGVARELALTLAERVL